jgi:putative transposase
MKKPNFISGKNFVYHAYNRGVEKRKIFLDEQDYLRFIHDLFEFNDTAPAGKFSNGKNINNKKRDCLVEILSFCLMPNHYHLALRQLKDGGIVKFIKKMNTGYTMSFNKKYQRVGCLFQGRFKAVSVEGQKHFLYLPYYLHSNPIKLVASNWQEKGIKDFKKTKNFLENYRWSSHLDYIGKKNFPSVISSKFLKEFWGDSMQYSRDFKEWLREF